MALGLNMQTISQYSPEHTGLEHLKEHCQKMNPRTYRLRAPKRTLPEDESIIELRLRHKIAFRRFVPEISQSYVYLMRTFHIGNIPFILIKGIALFFSHVLNIPYPREYYRCKYTSIYWLNEHLAVIRAYNATHLVKLNYKNQEYRLD